MPRLNRVLLAAVLLVVAAPTHAEHEVYYRYVVLGYVQDRQGAPVRAQAVALVRDRTGLAYRAATDADGFFVLVARLGDESAGEVLRLQVGDRQMRITVRFDPANHVDERGTRVDLLGQRFVERATAFQSTLARFLHGPDR